MTPADEVGAGRSRRRRMKGAPAIAVLGAGVWGANHLRVWNDLGCLRVVADPSVDRLALVKGQFPAVETSVDSLAVLERDDIDGVVIATPAVTHAELARRAIRCGKHVLVEKPMAVSAVEGESIVAAADGAGAVLMAGHVLEYHPAVRRLRELVDSGALGRVRYLYSHRLNFGRVRIEESALWSFAPHDIALCLRLTGTTPTTVNCQGGCYLTPDVADVTMMNMAFAGGVRAHVFVSWLHPFKEHRFVVVGDRQMAVFDDTLDWGEKLVLYPHEVDWMAGRLPVGRRADAVAVALTPGEPLRTECMEFVACIQTGRRALTDGTSALGVLRALDAAERSMAANGAAITPEAGPEESHFEIGEGIVPGPGSSPEMAGSIPVREKSAPPADEQLASVAGAIHPTAVIDPGATVGAGTRVWHFSHLMPGARVGKECSLGQNVFLGRDVHVGDMVKIQNNVSVYEGVQLEDGVFCGPSVVFTNVMNPRAEVDRTSEYRHTLVRRGASLGANATIVCGVTIGRGAFVGAGAVVTEDVPDFSVVVGVPARHVGWMCACGLRLELSSGEAACRSCGREYRSKGPDHVELMSG